MGHLDTAGTLAAPARDRRAAWLAWSLFAFTMALAGTNAWLVTSNRLVTDGTRLIDDSFSLGLAVFAGITTTIAAGAGAILAARRPDNPVGWLMLGGFLAFAIVYVLEAWGIRVRFVAPASTAVAAWAVVAWNAVGTLALAQLLTVFWVFPTGRLVGPRWRWPLRIMLAAIAVLVLSYVLVPGPMIDFVGETDQAGVPAALDNPLAIEALSSLRGFGEVIEQMALIVAGLLTLVAIVTRFRHARGEERAQLKWVLYAFGLLIAGIVGWALTGSYLLIVVTETALIVALPAAIVIAILKHRLWDIDRVISRTVSWGVVTAMLVGVYAVLVLLLREALGVVTGESDFADAVSLLVVAAMFNPVRLRVQHVVDRRFNRARYDAERTVEAFSEHLRDEVDLGALTQDLTRAVHQTVQPARVSIWIADR